MDGSFVVLYSLLPVHHNFTVDALPFETHLVVAVIWIPAGLGGRRRKHLKAGELQLKLPLVKSRRKSDTGTRPSKSLLSQVSMKSFKAF